MSFIYSQALVAEFLPGNCLATDVFAPLSGSHTPKPFSLPDRTTVLFPLSRFGLTCKPLTESHGAELLTAFLADFPAQISALPEKAQALTEKPAECGDTWPASLAKFDPVSCEWKTAQCLLLGGLEEFSGTWPRWGSMRDGECWERPTLARHTRESASGLWQTPVADDAVNRAQGKINSRGEPKLSAQVMQWPTPCANSHTGAVHGQNKTGSPNLQTMVAKWPTPTVCGNYNKKGMSKTSGDGLATAVRNWPTPTASASKGSSSASLTRKTGKSRANDRIDHAVMESDGGQLNPSWVEWLMGWPIGHTELKPLATDRFREWQQQHGGF